MDRVKGDTIYLPHQELGFTLAPNSAAHIQREVSKETVFTDSIGLRTPVAQTERAEAKIGVAGCSIALGVGCEYEESIVGQLETILEEPVATFGVGSYSLLQTVLRLEHLLEETRVEKIILLYGTWLINRSLQDRRDSIVYRPILGRVGKQLEILPPANPPTWLVNLYRSLEKSGTPKNWQKKLLAKLQGLAHRLRPDLEGYDDWEPLSSGILEDRIMTISYLMGRLAGLTMRQNVKVSVVHLYEYEREIRRGVNFQKFDENILTKVCQMYPHFEFKEDTGFRLRIKKFYDEKQTTIEDSMELIHWMDNNHPNPTGCRLIAEEVSEFLKNEEEEAP